jgi:hypothetical protein
MLTPRSGSDRRTQADGRRYGMDRRMRMAPVNLERRVEVDRRSGLDRRIHMDRRKAAASFLDIV